MLLFPQARAGSGQKRDAAGAFGHGRGILTARRVKKNRSTEQLYSIRKSKSIAFMRVPLQSKENRR
jgi:hypothetical protein